MLRLTIFLYAIFMLASTTTIRAEEAAPACRLDEATLSEMKTAARGIFSGLIFTDPPVYAGDLSFHDASGMELTLDQFKGKILAVNMWAMWCAPCRAEMADLAHLARQVGGDNFEVIAINMDRDKIENARIEGFLDEVGAQNLALYRDEKMGVFHKIRRDIPVRGLPVTLIIDAEGCVIASYAGAAPWGNEDAVHFVSTLKNLKNAPFQ